MGDLWRDYSQPPIEDQSPGSGGQTKRLSKRKPSLRVICPFTGEPACLKESTTIQ